MNYRKKEVIIQAVKWTGNNLEEVLFLDAPEVKRMFTTEVDGEIRLRIATLEGVMIASIGDYIIKGVKGELYPCKPDIFTETYETI